MSKAALDGLDDFVRQVNSKLAQIPRVVQINVAGEAATSSPVSSAGSSSSRGTGPSLAQIEEAARRGAQRALDEAGRNADIRMRST